MKVLLVKPYNLSDHIQPSLGLGYLATAIRGRHEVVILDCIKENVNIDKLDRILRQHRPDILGFQCYTFDLKFVTEGLKLAKKIRKDVITVVGGPHPSAIPEDLFTWAGKDLDFLFAGEAEIGLPLLLESLDNNRHDLTAIPGLCWQENGRIRSNPPTFPEDLDALGMPAWDLIHPEAYPESQHGAFYQKFPIAPIMVTRGCPYPCTFCAGHVVSGRKIRRRSVDHVIGEIQYIHREFGIREFHIVDDNFTQDGAYAKALLRKLKAMNLGMSWAVPNGIRMDPESALIWSPSHFTWMDTNYPAATPREGYPVEIQALWIRLLRQLERIAPEGGPWSARADLAGASLDLFWDERLDCFQDLLAGLGFTEDVFGKDSAFTAVFALQTLRDVAGRCESYSWWTISDIFDPLCD